MTSLNPTSGDDRLLYLDVLRALTLFGVLIANLPYFSGAFYAVMAQTNYPTGWGGGFLNNLITILIEGRSLSLLALLFGVGIAIQYERAMGKNQAFMPFALKRMGALAVFGIAHTYLIWNGDILLDYAIIGICLIALLCLRTSKILLASGVLLAFGIAQAKLLAPWMMQHVGSITWLPPAQEAYGSGTWFEALRFRGWEFNHIWAVFRFSGRLMFVPTFFAFGMAFWKSGVLKNPEGHIPLLRRILHIGLWPGVVLYAVSILKGEWIVSYSSSLAWIVFVRYPMSIWGWWGTTLGYMAGLLLLMQRPTWQARLAFLAPLGRMTLTTYLMQSIVCTWVFNGYGFGLWGRVPVGIFLAGGVLFFGFQVVFAHWWLRHYQSGPVEWIWRRISYGRPSGAPRTIPPIEAQPE